MPIMKQNDYVRNDNRLRLLPNGLKAKYDAWRRRSTWLFTKSMVKWILVISPPKAHHSISLLDLPLDILLIIFPLLSLLSQACLALTCKPLYSLFGHVLNDDSLAWPKLGRTYEIPVNQPELLRNQFLLRLEETLEDGVFDTSLPRTIREAFKFSVSYGKRCLMHECSINYHTHVYVAMKMMISLGKQRLVVQKTYHLHLNQPQLAREMFEPRRYRALPSHDMEPIFLCPYFDIIKFLYDPYQMDLGQNNRACSYCQGYIVGIEGAKGGLYVVVHWRQELGRSIDHKRWSLSDRSKYDTSERGWYLQQGDMDDA